MSRTLRSSVVALVVLTYASLAHAGHHQWIISELFTNSDGTVQFVELLGTADNEGGIAPFSINTFGTISTAQNLAPNLPAATLGKYLLVATAGYQTLAAAQGAPAPDRIMASNFLQLTADTVRYAGLATTDRVYTSIPLGGIDSLDYENPAGTVNTPENFAGATGAINAAADEVPVFGNMAFVLLALVLCGFGLLSLARSGRTA